MEENEFSRRTGLVKKWRIAVFVFFFASFFLSPIIDFSVGRFKEIRKERAAILGGLPILRAQLDSLSRAVELSESFSRDEYVRGGALALALRTKFESINDVEGMRAYAGICQSLLEEVSRKFLTWAETKDEDFMRNLALWKRRNGDNIDSWSVFCHSMLFSEAHQEVTELAIGGPPLRAEVLIRLGASAGKLYLYLIPCLFLMLLGNLYLYGRNWKIELVYGVKELFYSIVFAPFMFGEFGRRDLFQEHIQHIKQSLYPEKWKLTPEENAEVIRIATQPLQIVDKRIAQGRLAFLCTTILTFLSLPVFGQAKAGGGEKRGKANVTQVDSTLAKTIPVVINPPKISGQIRGSFTDKTGEFTLSNAIVTAEGATDGVGWKIEYDGNKNFLRCAQISAKIRWIAIRAGTMMTNWLYSNQAPHAHAVIGGTPLAGHIPLFGSGAEAEFRRGRFLSSLAYVGDGGLIGRIQYGTSALKGNVVGFFQDGKRKLGITTDLVSSWFEAHPMLTRAEEGEISISAEAGFRPIPRLYLFGAKERILGTFRDVWGFKFAVRQSLFLKLNFFSSGDAKAEFSFAF